MREYDLEEILAEFAQEQSAAEEQSVSERQPEEPAETWTPEDAAETANEDTEDTDTDTGWQPEEAAEPAEAEAAADAQLTQVFRVPKGTEKKKAPKPAAESESIDEEPEKPKKKKKKAKKESFLKRMGLGVLSLIFAVISLGVLMWSLQNLHPDTALIPA